MRWLSDDAVTRLRDAGSEPELSGTPYRMLDKLGRGGMGSVYLVEDSRLIRRVAMKVLEAAYPSGDLEQRLLHEARVLAQLDHPGIVPVHDVDTLADGRIFYTMKFVQGRRLDEIAKGSASLPERLRLFQKICEPVAFAHSRGVLHRDLKPENIMVGPFGEVLVMDWGVAKVLAATYRPRRRRRDAGLYGSRASARPNRAARSARRHFFAGCNLEISNFWFDCSHRNHQSSAWASFCDCCQGDCAHTQFALRLGARSRQ